MILEHFSVGPMQVNCYILAMGEDSRAVIIDPGAEARKIKTVLGKHKLKAGLIINTHGHYDHIGADDDFGVVVYVHKEDSRLLKDPQLNLSGLFALPFQVKSEIREVKDKEVIELASIKLKVLHIPGHTAGGIALLLENPKEKLVFTGDTLFCHGIGRSDLPGGSEALLIKSIKEKLLVLREDTVVYPGHGPASTIGDEKRENPFLTPF